ncbi:MAG: peptidylprolyl isomerase [Gammaproteobacteria bacterium]|nr:peptidylprolyl isomerase [Gammaproteobacteria bacterium]
MKYPILLPLLLLLPLPLQASISEINTIVAVVNEDVITRLELDERIETTRLQLQAAQKPLPTQSQLEEQILERLITERIQLELAKMIGVSVDDETLNTIILNIAQENRLSLPRFRQALEQEGITYSAFREKIRQEITISRLQTKQVDSKIAVTEQEVDHFLATSSELNRHREYRIAHILISTPEAATPQEIQQAETEANALYQQLRQGASFEELAIAHSDSPQALEGGDLGWRKADFLPTLFADEVLTMKSGAISPPLQNSSGFHLIKLVEQRSDQSFLVKQVNARHILLEAKTPAEAAAAKEKLSQLREALIQGADFGTLARQYSTDPGSATKGGELGWAEPSTYVAEFRRYLQTLKEGEISPPFATEFGWHLLQPLQWREVDNSDSVARQQAYKALHLRKLEEERGSWLRQIRDESYVEIRLNQ